MGSEVRTSVLGGGAAVGRIIPSMDWQRWSPYSVQAAVRLAVWRVCRRERRPVWLNVRSMQILYPAQLSVCFPPAAPPCQTVQCTSDQTSTTYITQQYTKHLCTRKDTQLLTTDQRPDHPTNLPTPDKQLQTTRLH